ncbi:sugar transferase [Nibrella saemangeumensis]
MNTVDRDPTPYILVVEDDDGVFFQIARLVNSACSVVHFRQAHEATQWLREGHKVDMIIAGEKNGAFDLIANIRNQAAFSHTPFLITSNYLSSGLLQNAIRSGATDVLLVNDNDEAIREKIMYFLSLQLPPFLANHHFLSGSVLFKLPWWKRLIDITVSLVALLLLSPVLLLVALLIRLDSRGPVLYSSRRVGTNFHVFNMFKFRTMQPKADKLIRSLADQNIYSNGKRNPETRQTGSGRIQHLCDSCRLVGTTCQRILFDQDRMVCEYEYLHRQKESATFLKFNNDPRVTRLGRFLRNSSIDELPQLYNILVGDMSLVGNRPLPLYEAEKLTTDEYVKRFSGPAGLTGLWQVTKRAKGQGPMSEEERIRLDIRYAETFSFWTDMSIIYKTFFSLWQKENV